jgi:RNA recognition motif-containing protein
VKDLRMIKNWQTKRFKGFAYIDYKDNGSVKKAIAKYHGKPYKGRNLICDAVTTSMKKGFKRFDKNGEE